MMPKNPAPDTLAASTNVLDLICLTIPIRVNVVNGHDTIVTIVSWPFTTFTLIGIVRQIKSRTFVEAARVSGAGFFGIMRRHILPNIAPLTLYLLSLAISGGVAAVAGLQFLGLAPLNLSTWGGMLNSVLGNFYYAVLAPWWVLPPAIALTMFIFAFIFASRGLDEVVNPRLRRR